MPLCYVCINIGFVYLFKKIKSMLLKVLRSYTVTVVGLRVAGGTVNVVAV